MGSVKRISDYYLMAIDDCIGTQRHQMRLKFYIYFCIMNGIYTLILWQKLGKVVKGTSVTSYWMCMFFHNHHRSASNVYYYIMMVYLLAFYRKSL